VLFHFCEGHGYPRRSLVRLPVARGYLWVEFFFALSGFVLTYVYAQRLPQLWRPRGYLAFLQSRLARLYPLHLAMLLLILFMLVTLRALAARGGYVSIYDEPWHPFCTWPTFIANLFLVHAWNLFSLSVVERRLVVCERRVPAVPAVSALSRFVARRLASRSAVDRSGAAALALLAHPRYGLDLTFHNGIYRGIAAFAMGVGFAVLHRLALQRGAAIIAGSGFLARATGDPRLPLVRDLPYGLVASACGHLHSSFRHRACFRSVVRPRLSRQGAGDADSAQARRVVLRDLHRPDSHSAVAAPRPAASLSRTWRYRVRQAMGSVGGCLALARTGVVGCGVRRVGRDSFHAHRTPCQYLPSGVLVAGRDAAQATSA